MATPNFKSMFDFLGRGATLTKEREHRSLRMMKEKDNDTHLSNCIVCVRHSFPHIRRLIMSFAPPFIFALVPNCVPDARTGRQNIVSRFSRALKNTITKCFTFSLKVCLGQERFPEIFNKNRFSRSSRKQTIRNN